MPPKRRAPAQTLSAHIDSSDEGSDKVDATALPEKVPAKRSSRRTPATVVAVETTAAAAVDKKGKKPTAAAVGGRKKKAAVNRVEEPTEDEDVPGGAEEEEGDEDEEDELVAAPVKGKKATTTGGRKATTAAAAKKAAAAAAVKSRPKRGAKKAEVEIEEDDEEKEATEEEEEVPAPVKKRGGRKAVPVAEKKKRMSKKEKDAAAAAAKKAEAEEQEKEMEIAETQYTPMQLGENAVDGEDDVMEVEATPTQIHLAPAVASKKAATVTEKKARASKAKGKAAKAVEPEVVEEDDDDDLSPPAKPPTPVAPKRAGRGAARSAAAVAEVGRTDAEIEDYKSLEKAFRELETKHKKLEYVRETEVEQTFARYKKNAEIKAKEADKLIDSLQTDLNAQARLSGESKTLKKKLAAKEAEVTKLQSKVQELQRSLQEQQNEAKVLSAKLIVAEKNSKRNAAAVPGSAVKPKGGIGGGGGMIGAGQAAEEAWIARVKEELFQDLTGLLVINVKKEVGKTVFECLQTSSTGGVTIHFKLQIPDSLSTTTSSSSGSRHQRKPSVAPDSKPTVDEGEDDSRDEIVYVPMLDKQRDRAVIALLPDYLKLEIGFKKEQMSDFFAKITAFMMNMKTKPILDDSGEEEEGDDDDDNEEEEEEEEEDKSKRGDGDDDDEEVGDA